MTNGSFTYITAASVAVGTKKNIGVKVYKASNTTPAVMTPANGVLTPHLDLIAVREQDPVDA
jgi:hypothetical protein